MQVFFGIYGALFFTMILGMIWPHKHCHELWQTLLGYIAKSLWLSWVLVIISFYTPLGQFMPALIVVLTMIILARHFLYPTLGSVFTFGIPFKHVLYLSAFFVSLFLVLVYLRYDLIFTSWDAVVSWNRWGIELAHNVYKPFNAAYPILFPGIWSLVYEAQGSSDVWIMAKSTMLILPIIILVMMYSMFAQGRYISGAIFSATAGLLLLRFFKKLTSGWMDYPVAALLLLGLVLLFYVVEKSQKLCDRRIEILLFSALVMGLAAITKQAGVFGVIPIIYMSALYYRRKEISLAQGLTYILISILPAILFYILFKSNANDLTGNLELLRSIVNSNVKYVNKYVTSLMKLVGLTPWVLLFIPAIVLIFKRDRSYASTQLAFICLAISVIGFVIYTDCCSYSSRNGAWIPIFLTVAAMIGAVNHETKVLHETKQKIISLNRNVFVFAVIGCGIFFAALSQFFVSWDEITSIQFKYQKRMGIAEVNEMIYKNKNLLGAEGVIVSGYQYISWLPGFTTRQYVNCSSDECVFITIKNKPGSLVLVHKFSEYHGYPKFRGSEAKGRLLGAVGDYELYQPAR